MKEELKQLKLIQNMMVLALLVFLFILATPTSALAQPLCDGKVPTIVGTETNDKLIGTDGPDVIHGLGGFDIIWGMGGDDVICGGDGADNLSGRDGNDIIFGENGNDSIWGGYGNDTVRGDDGNDSIYGGPGNDVLQGNHGNDSLYGRSGVDKLYGGWGTENNDSCFDDPGTFTWGCEQFNGEYIPPAPVPKTGQKSCSDINGTAIDCEGTGQDGELQKGVEWPAPRFSDNGDGTVTDHLAGLVWLKNADCFGQKQWTEALDVSSNLEHGQCGLSDGSVPGDWRLPNVREILSLVAFGQATPPLPIDHQFQSVGGEYWTSSTLGSDGEDGVLWSRAYTASLGHIPSVGILRKWFASLVWPLRGGN